MTGFAGWVDNCVSPPILFSAQDMLRIRAAATLARSTGNTAELVHTLAESIGPADRAAIRVRTPDTDLEAWLFAAVRQWALGPVDELFRVLRVRLGELGLSLKCQEPLD